MLSPYNPYSTYFALPSDACLSGMFDNMQLPSGVRKQYSLHGDFMGLLDYIGSYGNYMDDMGFVQSYIAI